MKLTHFESIKNTHVISGIITDTQTGAYIYIYIREKAEKEQAFVLPNKYFFLY